MSLQLVTDRVEVAARVVLGLDSLDEVVKSLAADKASAIAYIQANEELITAKVTELKKSGAFVEAKALSALQNVLSQIEDALASKNLDPSMLVRLADILHKLSGLSERRTCELRKPQLNNSPFSVHIYMDGTPKGLDSGVTIDVEPLDKEGEL
jgi:hypothetical protein